MRFTLNDNSLSTSLLPGAASSHLFKYNKLVNTETDVKATTCKSCRNINLRFPFVFLFIIILASSSFAQLNEYAPVLTPQYITVNRSLPKNILAQNESVPVFFSREPTDAEIYKVYFFEEPLVPMKSSVTVTENLELVYALAGFSQRKSADNFVSITNYLNENPRSRWRGALLANLGIIYRRTGYYNKAMEAWQEAWDLMKKETEPKIKVLADKVISELLLINCWVGRQEKIEQLLEDIDQRIIEGPAIERIVSAKEALWTMKNRPGIAFKCGPLALNNIYSLTNSAKQPNEKLMELQSSSKGFSLEQLQTLANEVKLRYQMAFRQPGAEVILNSVVHWKLDHYSALLKKESGHYKCEDATMGTVYGQQFWLTPEALDSSASGYFLVPEGPLPSGWRRVLWEEGTEVFGKGQEPPDRGKNTGDGDEQLPDDCGGNPPMARSNVHAAAISLHIFDRPLYYTPPKGPSIQWDLDYHQRDSYQPANFAYSNMGPKWTFKWLSYVQDNPNNTSANADVYMMGGGAKTFTGFSVDSASFPELKSKDVLVRVCPTCYELRHPDGSKEIYARPDGSTINGRKIFLTQIADAAGNKITLSYDAGLRIRAITDAIGQVTTIKYENSADTNKITRITDPFGRSAVFTYDISGKLFSIRDMIGIVSSFQYDAGDFITVMSTPYGNTSFEKGEGASNFRFLETTFPLGEKERVEFAENAPGIPFSESIVPAGMNLFNAYLTYRNTFFWDKKAMREAKGDYTKAKIYHWLHGSSLAGSTGGIAPILESIKEPLENRVWYNYQGQSAALSANQGMSSRPSIIGRVLDDGTTQHLRFTYNQLGYVTSSTDPAGRTMAYKYDSLNNTDLLEVRQTTNGANDLLAKYVYNNQHLPLTSTDASGLISSFTYNTAGQLKTAVNPKKETSTFFYKANGYIDSITGPVKDSRTAFTYDGFGRVRTISDQEGYIITTDYDALDRPTLITYPDKTFEQVMYNRLDAVRRKDRLGRWSHTIYDSLQRPTVIQDALGRVTQLLWCNCGSLSQIVDPQRQITTFNRDLQGRLISKTYHDGKSIQYQYENTSSRLREITDSKGQKTQYSYFIDDNLKQISYINTAIATGAVSFTYDENYNRTKSMTDTTGITTYNYYPINLTPGAGFLSGIDGPLSNDDISYIYDSVGRVISRSINGVASSVVYDKLARITAATNVLGNFKYNYINQTNRLSSTILPNGQNTSYTYYDNPGDQRLKQIWNRASGGATVSKFNYEHNAEAQITKWVQQAGTGAAKYYELSYDLSDQLISATQKNQNTNAILKRYAYQYNKAGNRTSEQVDKSVTSALYNPINQLTKQQSGGAIHFKGSLNEFSSVLIKHQTSADSVVAYVDTTNTFEGFIRMLPGNNNISITAKDYSGKNNQQTNTYTIAVNNGLSNTLSYDDNGNSLTATNPAVSYGWDAADRLVRIIKGTNITEFVYDGLSRRVAEKLNGAFIRRWVWCGMELCEERDAGGGTINKRFFTQGEQVGTTNYYFTKDHLGSIREVTDANGSLVARYDYDPYGRRVKVSGSFNADLGYTGHYFHDSSKLHLAIYRAYDGSLGRWLSRDPLSFSEIQPGLNSYQYVFNNPIRFFDPDGEFAWIAAGAVIGAVINVGITYAANGGNVTGQQLLAAAASGAVSGAIGAVAGPLGGTIARGLGAASNGLLASAASGLVSAAGSGLGQAAANLIDPCNATNPLNAALYGGIGGGLAKGLFPTRNLNSLAQARYFGPRTFGGLTGSTNAWFNAGSFAAASAVGGASNFSSLNPF